MTIKVIQRKDLIKADGTCPLFIRFTHERKVKYVGLGVSVKPNYWCDQTQKITIDCQNHKEQQLIIDTKLAEYDKKIKRLEALDIPVNLDTLLETKSRYRPNQTVAEYFDKVISDFERSGKLSTASKYYFCLSSLKKFRSMDITFDRIDKIFLREFEQYLRDRGLSSNTIATKFTNLKSVYNKALEDGIFTAKENPFAKFRVGKLWTKTRKRAITKEDILRLKNLELSKDSHYGYKELSRDIFMFSYYTAGINFKDIATLRYCDIINGRVYYQRHKTSKEISCFLMPDALLCGYYVNAQVTIKMQKEGGIYFYL